LPELRKSNRDRADQTLLRHLLAHSSGYRGLNIMNSAIKWGLSWGKFVDFFGSTTQSFPPGTVFNYEHSEHVILGKILERTTGKSPRELIYEEIFEPLNIGDRAATRAGDGYDATSYVMPPAATAFERITVPSPSVFWEASLSNLALTVSEIVSIGEVLLGFSAPDLPFSKFCLTGLMEPEIDLPAAVYTENTEQMPLSFGVCGAQYGEGVFGHNGSIFGQTCALRLVPEQGVVVAVAINAWLPNIRDRVVRSSLAAFGHESLDQNCKPSRRTARWDFDLEHLPGCYVGGAFDEVVLHKCDGGMEGSVSTTRGRYQLFKLVRGIDGSFAVRSSTPNSVGFFQHPERGSPCMIVGPYTYCKQ